MITKKEAKKLRKKCKGIARKFLEGDSALLLETEIFCLVRKETKRIPQGEPK